MALQLTVLTPSVVDSAKLKQAIRDLGGTWIRGVDGGYGVIGWHDSAAKVSLANSAGLSGADKDGMRARLTADPVSAVAVAASRGAEVDELVHYVAHEMERRWKGCVREADLAPPLPPFRYFAGPRTDMSHLVSGASDCSLCGRRSACFTLPFLYCPEIPEDESDGKVGCVDCLKAGRFIFRHELDIGYLDEHGLSLYRSTQLAGLGDTEPIIPEDAQEELRRTPSFHTWQSDFWLTHCADFMIYLGTWEPADFAANSPTGDGYALFLSMTDPDSHQLWNPAVPSDRRGESPLQATYYAFRCSHCGRLRGYCDNP